MTERTHDRASNAGGLRSAAYNGRMGWQRLRLHALSVSPPLIDGALALFLWGVGAIQLWNESNRLPPPGFPRAEGPFGMRPFPDAPDSWSYVLLGLSASFLVLRRRSAAVSLAGVALFGAAFLIRGEPVFPVQLMVLVAITTVVADSDLPRRVSIPLSLASAGLLGAALYFNEDPRSNAAWAMNAAWIAAAILLGDSMRSRREVAFAAERSRDDEARRRVSEERLQIARELHDVVGHNIALINVQASAGAHVLYNDPQQARDTFGNIRQASHETLQGLRSMVGVLREPLGDGAKAPTVGLDALDELINAVVDAGQTIDLHIMGDKRRLSGVVDLSAYRILQEALTNTIQHAPRSRVHVSVEFRDEELALAVTNGPGAPGEARSSGGGHGLLGMRERVAAIGGRLEAGPRPDGGFRIEAVLPLKGTPA